jgi:hypothetical protein
MKKQKVKKGYPTTLGTRLEMKTDLLDWGVNRIYKVSKDDAILISKEFGLSTNFKSTRDESEFDFYYFNHANGEFHAIFSLPRSK